MTYYDDIAQGYDALHKEEQLKKLHIISSLNVITKDDVLLDVGCGTGFSLDFFTVKKAYGVDPAKKLVEQYRGTQHIQVGFAELLPFSDSFFDVVISVTAIQNFDDIQTGLEEIRRVGKTRFILSVLKKSQKIHDIESMLYSVFEEFAIEKIEEEKDYIYVILL